MIEQSAWFVPGPFAYAWKGDNYAGLVVGPSLFGQP